MKVLVLYGGNGSEREVSVKSALRVIATLREIGHCVRALDYRGKAPDKALCQMANESDAVFLALHGGDGEGGILQGALEDAGIFHYIGTGPRGAALSLDKARAKRAVEAAGVAVARGAVWMPDEALPFSTRPAVMKPLSGGSSVGLTYLEEKTVVPPPSEPMLLEELLPGREYTVGILGGRVLPTVEIRPKSGVYDYHSKYTRGAALELCPAPLDGEKEKALGHTALKAFAALGLRDFARIDFKEDSYGTPVFLEANTLPGLTETSLLPLAAKAAGLSFSDLLGEMLRPAAERKKAP